MAIYNAVPPPEELTTTNGPVASPSTPVTNGAIDIDAWTISALQSLSVSPVARGTGTPLVIPIDVDTPSASHRAAPAVAFDAPADDENALPRRPPSRRDSMKRREALLRGNEGSRQRRRWENGICRRTLPPPSSSHHHHHPLSPC